MTGAFGLTSQTGSAAEPVSLDVNARVENDALLVRYTLVNRRSDAIITFDGATGTGGGEYPNMTGQCYISEGSNGLARILRIRPRPHPTARSRKLFVPAVAEVKAGETRRVQFRLPFPVKERSEYSPEFSGATWDRRAMNRLELRIGWFPRTASTELKPLGAPNVYLLVRGASIPEMHEVAATTGVAFDLMVRTDPQFIRM
jgi:hypothetical protein